MLVRSKLFISLLHVDVGPHLSYWIIASVYTHMESSVCPSLARAAGPGKLWIKKALPRANASKCQTQESMNEALTCFKNLVTSKGYKSYITSLCMFTQILKLDRILLLHKSRRDGEDENDGGGEGEVKVGGEAKGERGEERGRVERMREGGREREGGKEGREGGWEMEGGRWREGVGGKERRGRERRREERREGEGEEERTNRKRERRKRKGGKERERRKELTERGRGSGRTDLFSSSV